MLVCGQLKSRFNVVWGKKPTSVGDELHSEHYSFGNPSFEITAASKSVTQTDYGDDLSCSQNCILVKLREAHDYLMIHNAAGKDS